MTTYGLEINRLSKPYHEQGGLTDSRRLYDFESSTPFGTFCVGDSVSQGPSMEKLGRIQHIAHWVGDYRDGVILHKTVLYVFD